MLEQSLVDDAHTTYEYGLPPSAATAPSNEFSFVDQRVPMQASRQTPLPAHHSWFGAANQQHPFFNRTYPMPQQTNLFVNNDSQRMIDEQQQMAAAMLMHQQQQNWARQQQMFPPQQQPPPAPQQIEQVTHRSTREHCFDLVFFLQNVLRLLSMLSLQQQTNMINNDAHHAHLAGVKSMSPLQQENQHDRASVNTQQGLADNIQAVRHLWDAENANQLAHSLSSHNHAAVDSGMYNAASGPYQASPQGFMQFQ